MEQLDLVAVAPARQFVRPPRPRISQPVITCLLQVISRLEKPRGEPPRQILPTGWDLADLERLKGWRLTQYARLTRKPTDGRGRRVNTTERIIELLASSATLARRWGLEDADELVKYAGELLEHRQGRWEDM